jgi:DNA-binding NarL/FixJ family response regulator
MDIDMQHVVLADNQAIFRAGAARVLATEGDIRLVAQCADEERLLSAVDSARGAITIFSASIPLDRPRLLERIQASAGRAILIIENGQEASREILPSLSAILTRSVSGTELVQCVRKVASGQRCIPRDNVTAMQAPDSVGRRVHERLTPKERQIVALIVQGCKNKEIASQLGTKEQVIKNYLRSIYDKTGVSDRLELALFTIHHRVLANEKTPDAQVLHMRSA